LSRRAECAGGRFEVALVVQGGHTEAHQSGPLGDRGVEGGEDQHTGLLQPAGGGERLVLGVEQRATDR
jgi:hypothetical protein